MPEDPHERAEEPLDDFAQQVASIPPWSPDPEWVLRVKAKLLGMELEERPRRE